MPQNQWVRQSVHSATCVDCGESLTSDDVEGVGVRYFPDLKMKQLTMAFTLCRCPHCDAEQTLQAWVSYPEVRDAVWQFFTPGPHHEPEQGAAETQADNASRARNLVRPSKRARTPRRPISKEEANKFIRRLHRTSFKLGTKGLNEFLGRIRRGR